MILIECLTCLVFNVKSLLIVVRLSVVLALLMSLNLFVVAQSAAARPERGIAPANSYAVSDIESVSLTNGNLSLSIPLAALPPMSGGKLSWALRAVYNSKAWDTVRSEIQPDPMDPYKYTVSHLQLSGVSGWRLGARYEIRFQDSDLDYSWIRPANQSQDPEYNLLTQNSWKKVVLATPDGATHELRPTDYSPYIDFFGNHPYLRGYYKDNPNTISAPMRYYSVDGSRIWVKIDSDPNLFAGNARSWTLYLPDGTKVEQLTSGIQRITDTNGNKVKIWSETDGNGVTTSHYQDELTEREIKYIYNPAGNGGLGSGHMQYQTVGGAWVTIDINFGTTRVQGKIYQIGDAICGDASNLVDQYLMVVRSIVLPLTQTGLTRKQFTFTYNSDTTNSISQQWRPNCSGGYQTVTTASYGWGSLSRMVTPHGARVDYVYNHDGWHTLGMNPDDAPRESMISKTIKRDSDGALFGSWTYGVVPNGGSVTNPDGSTVTETMYPYDRAFAQNNAGFGGKEGLTYRTDNSGKVRIERHWTLKIFSGGENIAPGAGTFVTFNPVVDAEYTSLMEGGQPVKMSAKTFQYDYNGNLLEEKSYDWFDPALVSRDAQGVPTGVPASATLLRTTTNTFYNDSTASTSANVYAKRAVATGLPLILNAVKETITGPSQTRFSYDNQGYAVTPTLGNLTKVSHWDDQNFKWLDTVNTYDTYGNLITTVAPKGVATTGDPNDFITTFTYDPATHATVTQVMVDPRNGTGPQTTTMVSDYSTGRSLSQTDANGQTVTISYANHLLAGAIDPYMRPGLVTNLLHQVRTNYDDNLRQVIVESDLSVSGDRMLKTRTTADELGRVILTERNEDGTSNYSISSQNLYFEMGRITMASNPNRGAAAATDGWTRATRDGLGRVTEVTTFATATQPPISGTNTNWTGSVTTIYNANEVTVADQNSKQRKSVTDALGRLIQVNEAPNDSAYNYQTNYTYDVLGNLIRVRQGGFPTGGSSDPTVQFRRFYYDSLSRLIYANNPEQNATIAFDPPGESGTMWTMKYVYDDNGNLTSRTDARGVTTAYGYDGLNRNTTVNYSNTPSISPDIERYYDTAFNGKGRLQRVVSNLLHPGNGSRVDSQTVINAYDHLGRVVSQTQRFLKPGTSNWLDYFISRTFDLAGNLTSQNNPEFGRTVSYSYGANGRLSNFSGNLGDPLGFSSVYTDQFEYSAAGQMTKERLGTGIPLYHHSKYNSRHQMVETSVGTSSSAVQTGAWDRGRLLFFYNTAAMTAGDPSVEGSGNNGNVLRQEHWVPTSVSNQYAVPMRDDYEYDPINRITKVKGRQRTAATFPGQGTLQDIYQQAYSYDKFGNRKLDMTQTWGTGINGSVAAHIYDVDKPTNRLAGMVYDAAGNLVKSKPISPQPENRVYDAENRMITATLGATSHYVYDGDGRRVRRILPSGEFWQVYGIDGELLAEYQWNGSTASLKKEYGYRDGQLLVVADPTEANADKRVQWLIADHLGTPRLVVDKTGSLSGVTRHDYLPFGEELMVGMGNGSIRTGAGGMGYQADSVRQKFTGKDRDIETGLDYFGARYYSNIQGRFTSPDQPFADQEEEDPQSWNLYSYVRNNPVLFVDPFGLWRRVYLDDGVYYEAEKGDTFSGLAEIIGVSADALVKAFGTDKIAVGDIFDIGSFFADQKQDYSFTRRSYAFEEIQLERVEMPEPQEMGLPVGALVKAAAKRVGKNNWVYRSINPATGKTWYVGITSNLARRAAQHLRGKGIAIEEIPLLKNLSRADARAVEQALIELHGLGKNGGTLIYNQINSIAKNSPAYAEKIQRGLEILKKIGYPGL